MNERDLLEVVHALAAEERRLRNSPDADPDELDHLTKQRDDLLVQLRRLRAEQSGPIELPEVELIVEGETQQRQDDPLAS